MEEEQRQILDRAANYDAIISSSGYAQFCTVMADRINSEIAEATTCPLEPEKQRIHIIRWNAMREVLDAAINDVNDTRKFRDEIVTMQKEIDQWQTQQ